MKKIKKGTFKIVDSEFYVQCGTGEKAEMIPLCSADTFDLMSDICKAIILDNEPVNFEIVKVYLPGTVEYFAKLAHNEPVYTVQDIIDAVEYGFRYRDSSMHDGFVPVGNTLQWLMSKKGLIMAPKSWEKFKQ